jgi:nicotinamidase/pyrazinamidase
MPGVDARRRSLVVALGALGVGVALRPVSALAVAHGPWHPDAHSALIIVDVQTCFVAGGSLPVPHGEEVIPLINRIAGAFATVVATQDWHSVDHVSFASSHPGRKPFDSIDLAYGRQVLWPDHCVMGTEDAQFARGLDTASAQLIIRKGFHRDIDSYSAFLEADRRTTTGLAGYLRARQVRRVYVCGLATDFCVAWTALDARRAGFDAAVIEDASRGIDLNGSLDAAWKSMSAAGVHRISSAQLGII